MAPTQYIDNKPWNTFTMPTFSPGGHPVPVGYNGSSGATVSSGGGYNVNPTPTTGTSAYGMVPGQIGIPPNRYQGVASIYPGLDSLTGSSGDLIKSQLAGEFSPETEAALWDTANRYGVASGMPGAGLWSNKFMGNVAGAKEGLQQKGLSNYNSFLSTMAPLVDDPNLLASIAQNNAVMASLPDPGAAAALKIALEKLGLTSGVTGGNPAGGTGGASGGWNPMYTGNPNLGFGADTSNWGSRLNSYNSLWGNQSPAAATGPNPTSPSQETWDWMLQNAGMDASGNYIGEGWDLTEFGG